MPWTFPMVEWWTCLFCKCWPIGSIFSIHYQRLSTCYAFCGFLHIWNNTKCVDSLYGILLYLFPLCTFSLYLVVFNNCKAFLGVIFCLQWVVAYVLLGILFQQLSVQRVSHQVYSLLCLCVLLSESHTVLPVGVVLR